MLDLAGKIIKKELVALAVGIPNAYIIRYVYVNIPKVECWSLKDLYLCIATLGLCTSTFVFLCYMLYLVFKDIKKLLNGLREKE